MKESKFVGQNKDIWLKFETDLRERKNKSRLSNLFTQFTDDLSYARTFYKFRSVKLYLNGIAQILFNTIYRNQSGTWNSFLNFWKIDLPLQVHAARKEFRISFVIFLIAVGIGMLSSIYDKDFAISILGKDYINMTVENIKNHDPLAVYKKGNEAEMFLGITINNLSVSLITFVLGAFMAVGTVLALIRNGIMVGVFQYFFIERGLFKESFLTIWQHGTIEISCIIIAGAAGMTLGKGLIFPGTYSRMQAFKISTRRGLKIFTGITPLIILAAFIEGFITRHTEVNIVIRIVVICVSLGFIVAYFGWYPRYVSKRVLSNDDLTDKIQYQEPWKYDFSRILTANETLGYTFKFFNQNIVFFIVMISLTTCFHAIAKILFELQKVKLPEYKQHTIESFFKMDSLSMHFWLGIISISICFILLSRQLHKLLSKKDDNNRSIIFKDIGHLILSSVIASFILLIPFAFGYFWGILSIILLSPFLFLAVYTSYLQKQMFLIALGTAIKLTTNSWDKLLWNSIKIFGFVVILYVLTNSFLGWQFIEAVFLNLKSGSDSSYIIEQVVITIITILLFAIYFYFQIVTVIFSYYSLHETIYAENLNQRIDKLGDRTVLFGFEKEK